MKKNLPLSQVYKLIEPGPVVLLTTARNGQPDVMTLAWHTMIDFEPPLIGCVISEANYSFANLKATKQCAINIPTVELAKATVGCGNVSGRTVDKFAKFGLTPVPAAQIDVPLVAECYANLECKLVDAKMASKYNFFILEVVTAWLDRDKKNPRTIHHLGKSDFMVSGKVITVASKMK